MRGRCTFLVRKLCRVLKGLPKPLLRLAEASILAPGALEDAVLTELRAIHAASDGTYGSPNIHAELRDEGTRVGCKRVARLMRVAHLRGVSRRRGFAVTTRRNPALRPAPDLVKREFTAEARNQLWGADMIYVPTWAGFVFLVIVLNVWRRRILGWSIGEQMSANLVLAALNMATTQRRPRDVIHHSDQGSQDTSLALGLRCAKLGVRLSMGSVGDARDNAMPESLLASPGCELIDGRSFQTKAEARLAWFTYIEGGYNPRHRYSALGRISPINFERSHTRDTFPVIDPAISAPETARFPRG